MRRGVGVLLLVAVTMATALLIGTVPEALAEVEAFRVQKVVLDGERYLDEAQLRAVMELTPETSVWDDLEPIADRVRRHPLVLEARVRRRLPGTLRVEVQERRPVALVATPVLVPVDGEGRVLPVDPVAHRLDLPLLESFRVPWEEGVELTPRERGILAREAARLGADDPGLLSAVSELAINPRGDVLMRLAEPRVTFTYTPPASSHRLREGLRVLSDARARSPDRMPVTVDLRFEEQVVVRFPTSNGR